MPALHPQPANITLEGYEALPEDTRAEIIETRLAKNPKSRMIERV